MGKENCGCGGDSCNTSSEQQQISQCPECGSQAVLVKNVTVTHQLKPSARSEVKDQDFHLCLNHSCVVGYFNLEDEILIHKDDFKRPIWFKADASPVIACYCKNITEEDVIKTVVETGLRDPDTVSAYLKGGRGSNCEITHPAGICCDDGFNLMIRNGLTVKFILEQYSDLQPNLHQDTPDVEAAKEASSVGENCGCGCDC